MTLTESGPNALSSEVTNYAGLSAISDDVATINYDPTPTAPTVSLPDDASDGKGVTSDGLVLEAADPNTTVTINEGAGVAPFTTTTDANGAFSFTLTPDTIEYSVVASDTSLTGVVGVSSCSGVLAQPSSLSRPTLQLVRVSGVDGATNDPDILVRADANTLFTISDDGAVIGAVAGDGGLTAFDPTLADGAYDLTAIATNLAEPDRLPRRDFGDIDRERRTRQHGRSQRRRDDPNGTQTLTAVQMDAAADVGSASVTVHVQRTPPVVAATPDGGDGPNTAQIYVQKAVIDVSATTVCPASTPKTASSSPPLRLV